MEIKKKFTVWTIKGGNGKTSISAEIAMRLNLPIITNEPYTTLDIIFNKDRLLQLKKNQPIPYYKNQGMIFDFGGYIDNRIIDAIKQSDYIIVPTIPEISDIQVLLNSIVEIEKYNKNIIIVVNKTETEQDIDIVKSAVKKIGEYPIFDIKKSRALPNLYIDKMSILQMVSLSKVKAWNYRKINKQFNNIIEFITK